MIRILAFILCLLFQQTYPAPGPGRQSYSAGGCTPPSYTSIWAAYPMNGAFYCTAVLAGITPTENCANGAYLATWLDSVAANNAATGIETTNAVFATPAINSFPALTFNAFQGYTIATPIATSVTTYSFYAVVKPTTGSTIKIMGGATTGGLRWYISSTGHQTIGKSGSSTIATGSAVLASGTWVTLAFTYNSSTGSAALYTCSGGTCSSDGTATSAQTLTTAISTLSIADGSGGFNGQIAEIGYLNGVSNNGVGSWSQCKYGI